MDHLHLPRREWYRAIEQARLDGILRHEPVHDRVDERRDSLASDSRGHNRAKRGHPIGCRQVGLGHDQQFTIPRHTPGRSPDIRRLDPQHQISRPSSYEGLLDAGSLSGGGCGICRPQAGGIDEIDLPASKHQPAGDEVTGSARFCRDNAPRMTSQSVDEAALAGIHGAGEHYPPGFGQPEAHPRGPQQPVDRRSPVAAWAEPGNPAQLLIKQPGSLPDEDLGWPRAGNASYRSQCLTLHSSRPLSPQPGLPALANGSRAYEARDHCLRRSLATVAVHFQMIPRMPHDNEFLARSATRIRRCLPDSHTDRTVVTSRKRRAPARPEAPVGQFAGPGSSQANYSQRPSAAGREQRGPDRAGSRGLSCSTNWDQISHRLT